MGKQLVLAEKPSVGREIAKVLKCTTKGNGYIEGDKYIVTWSLGHLVTLGTPEVYSEKYKTWKMEDLPMLPDKLKLVVIKNTAKQFSVVRELLNRKDIDELIIATDSGREGELVARWIMVKAGFKKKIKRLWISSQTDKAIKDGFNNLKNGNEFDNLYKSAQCRAEADWYVGLNITRALTCKYNAQLSSGRVQTPTLAIIVDRENEIRRFVPKDYWTIKATAPGFYLNWQDKATKQIRIFDKNKAEKIISDITNQNGVVTEIKKDTKKEFPPLLYDLTELQRDANRRFSFSPKKTLSVMQKLYEQHKLLTYPRTDSKHLTDDIVPTLLDRLKSISIGPYLQHTKEIIKNKLNITKRIVDNKKVTDHHAIIPTEQYVDLSSLTGDERKIYDMIVKRFISALYPPFEYQQTIVIVEVKGQRFTAKGKIVKSKGWKDVYQENIDSNEDSNENIQSQLLPDIQKGASLNITSSKINAEKTKPPSRHNEATLLSAMEHPGKYIEDDKLREEMENSIGLGTPATRAEIIEKLFESFYIEKRGRDIYPTSKGIQIIDLVPSEMKSPELTAKWEKKLQLISQGKINANDFIKEIKAYSKTLITTVKSSESTYKHDNLTRENCPECGKFLLEVSNKKVKC